MKVHCLKKIMILLGCMDPNAITCDDDIDSLYFPECNTCSEDITCENYYDPEATS